MPHWERVPLSSSASPAFLKSDFCHFIEQRLASPCIRKSLFSVAADSIYPVKIFIASSWEIFPSAIFSICSGAWNLQHTFCLFFVYQNLIILLILIFMFLSRCQGLQTQSSEVNIDGLLVCQLKRTLRSRDQISAWVLFQLILHKVSRRPQ